MKIRKLTSLVLLLSFIVMSYTGLILFIVPQGKVAYWSNWKFLGLTKTQYGNLHTTFMILFLAFSIIHIYLNWQPIVSYLKNSARKISFTKKEFVAAFILNAFFAVGTLYMTEPFKAYLNFEDDIKTYWADRYGEPPYGHAEESSLQSFCKKMGINIKEAAAKLKSKNISIKSIDETLKSIAQKNNITPKHIYEIIKGGSTESIPASLGKQTLKSLSDAGKINLQKAISYLKSKGINNIDKNVTIKEIADKLSKTPVEIYKALRNQK